MTAKTSNKKTKTEIIKPSDEDLILGATEEIKTVQVTDYQNINVRYKVFIYQNGREITVNGREIGTFLGQKNEARKKLEQGQTNITVLDSKGEIKLYDIEVLR